MQRRGQVVQNIQHDHGVGRTELGAADVGLQPLGPGTERATGTLDLTGHQFDTAYRQLSGCRRPMRWPASACVAALRSLQPRRQQTLTGAQIEYMPTPEQQPALEDGTIGRIAAQLAAGEIIGEAADRARSEERR